ncbi:MAG: MarR family transcriptional regulator [candidate division Zixibacteria bacterium]|nr:MarR family transcriptional regulator [candidate division Zixibacteria bacterium]
MTQSLEDYLEAIYMIQQENSVARVKDIASKMDVSPPSVTGAIKSLKTMGLVKHSHYGYVELSPKGIRTASEIFKIHETLTDFLHKVLGISPDAAESDACKIEHVLEPETVKRITEFLEFSLTPQNECGGCATRFKEWLRKKGN